MALSDKISNIIGVPIPDVINDQLQLRSQMNSLETRDIDNIRYLENKTAWVRLISSVNLTEQADIRYFNNMGLNINISDPSSLAKQFVLFGGTSAYTKNKQGYYYAQKSGILGGEGFSPAYSPFGTKEIQDYGYRPMPGIMDVNIDSQGRMGSVRSAKINFKCWDKYQLDVIDTLYFRLGFMMFLEWGNTYFYNKNKSGQVELQSTEAYSTKIDPFKPGLYKEEIVSRISRLNRETAGNYDAMLGMVSNFSFSMNQEGGYDCNLTLISLGILAESIKINTFSSGNNVLNIALDTYNKNLESASLNEAVKSISSGSDFQLSKLSPQNLVPTLIQLKDKPAVSTYKYIYPSNITAKNTITMGPPQSANKPAEDVPNVNVYFNTREGGSSIERTFLRKQGVVIPHNNTAVVEIDANAVNQLNTNQSFQIDVNRLKEVLSRSTYIDDGTRQLKKIDPNDLSTPMIARLANLNSFSLPMNYTGLNDGQYYVQFVFHDQLEHIVKGDESGVTIDDTVKASLTRAGITSYKELTIDPGWRDYIEFFGTEITDDVIEYRGKTSAQAFKDTMDLFYAALQKNRYNFAISGDNYYFKVLIERPLTVVVEVNYTNESGREVTVDKPITMNYVFPLVVIMNDSYLIKDGSVNPGDATQPSSGKEPAPDANAAQGATAEAATVQAANNPNPDQTSEPQTVSSEATQEPLSVMSTLEASLFAIKVFGLDKTRDKKLNDPLGARVEKVSFIESTAGESFHSNLFANGVFSSFINELIEGTISDSKYEDPSIGKLEKLKIAAKYGFATNLLTGFTKIREAGANNFYPVNYQDLMNCYVFAYEFDPSGLDLGTKTEKPVYITLGTLLMILNSNCTIYDTTDKSAQTPLIYIDFNPYHNLCLSCPQHLSIDPWTAMINFEGGDKGYASIFPPEILEQAPNGSILIKAGAPDQESTYLFRPSAVGVQTNGDRVSGYVPSFHIPGPLSDFDSIKEPATISNFQGYIMNTLLNVDYLAKIVREEASRSDENKVFLKSFIEQILVDLNKCLGNFNTFRMSYNDGANCIQIIDDQLIPTSGQRQLSNKTNSDLPLFGRTSIAKSLEIKTEISTRLSNMIAISANSGVKTANGNDASSYGFMNKKLQDRYVGDRSNIKPQAAENQETGLTAEEQQLQTQIMIQAAVQFNSAVKSIYGPSSNPSKDAVDAATNYYAEQLSYFKAVEPTIQGANMIPVSVNFSTDGISGLAMGHAFTVPDQILPYVYSTRKLENDGSLRKVGFVIKSLSNSIRSNTWTTSITSDMIFLKDNSSITPTAVLYIPSNLTSSVVDETKTKNERGEYAVWQDGKIIGYEPIMTIQEGGFAANILKKYEAPFRELQRAAKAAGHNLYLNSGFRTFSEQLELRRKHCKNPARKSDLEFLISDRGDETNFNPLTVRPGYSPHQRGIGFDFVVKGRIPLFKWLEQNAWKYSFYRVVPSERWHWNYKPDLAKTKDNTYHKVGIDHISWKQEDF